MPMYLYLGDITRMETDAIVNAAGTDLRRCRASATRFSPPPTRRSWRGRAGSWAAAASGRRWPRRAAGCLPVHHSRGRAGLVRWGAPGAVPAGRVLPERPA